MSSIPLEYLLIGGLAVVTLSFIMQVILLFRKTTVDFTPVLHALQSIEQSCARIERSVREEIAENREEAAGAFRQSREELANTLKGVGDTLYQQVGALTQTTDQKLERVRETVEQRLQVIHEETTKKLEQVRLDSQAAGKMLREELGVTLKLSTDTLTASIGEMSKSQSDKLMSFGDRLEKLTQSNEQKLDTMRDAIGLQLQSIQEANSRQMTHVREESSINSKALREEVITTLKTFAETQKNQLDSFSMHLAKLAETNEAKLTAVKDTLEKRLEGLRTVVDERLTLILNESTKKLDQMRQENGESAKQMRNETSNSLKSFNDSVLNTMTGISDLQKKEMGTFTTQLGKLTESNEQKLDGVRKAVEEKLKAIQDDNAKQLDQMRITVDEKLQGTLEKRLGESFKQVSERLEQVYKGLGEMQTLATGVGDLKKVLTNVKSRGTWGEIQLGALLEQVLSPDQYATNVSTKDGGERVEFAIKLPGRSEEENEVVWLPIDAKFPVEDYQRLIDAQERADAVSAEDAAKQLEYRIKQCAADICKKYLNPPKTTDFAILFLPTEGLFAEVIRRTGLPESIQRDCRVMIAGPTTLWSILNSLQMGFRTLAIQKRSSEVWNLLAAVKTEWTRYGEVLEKVQKKLQEASNTIEKAQTRTRVIGRKLRGVQELPVPEAQAVLMVESDVENGSDEVDAA